MRGRPLIDGALQTLLPHRDVEAGLAQRARERAERVPEQRLRRHRALARIQVARRRRPPEPGAERLQLAESSSRVAKRRGTRPASPLRGVPAAEVLDHRLRVHGRLRVGGELPHRRGPPQPGGAVAQLLQDRVIRVALANAGAGTPRAPPDRCLPPRGGGGAEPCNQSRANKDSARAPDQADAHAPRRRTSCAGGSRPRRPGTRSAGSAQAPPRSVGRTVSRPPGAAPTAPPRAGLAAR